MLPRSCWDVLVVSQRARQGPNPTGPMMRPREWGCRCSFILFNDVLPSSRLRRSLSYDSFNVLRGRELTVRLHVLLCGINIFMCASSDVFRLFSVYGSRQRLFDLESAIHSTGMVSVP